MDPVALAKSVMALSQAKAQLAVAGKLAKMDAGQARSVGSLVEAANTNMAKAAKAALPPGLGAHVDISA